MPPPGSFFDITAVPYSRVVTVAEFNVANEIWFRFITGVAVAFGHWTSRPAGVALTASIYESDGSTLIQTQGSSTAWWRRLVAGTYYIKIARVPVNPIAADFTYEADTKPMDVISYDSGAVLISDDTGNIAGTIINSNGSISTFASAIPAGEIGDATFSGHILVHDRFGQYGTVGSLQLFNPTLSTRTQIVPSTPFFGPLGPRVFHSATDFWVVDAFEGFLYRVSPTTGLLVFVATIADILADGVDPIGITGDGAIVYFAVSSAVNNPNGNIKKYVVSSGVTTVHHTIAGYVSSDSLAQTFDGNPGDLVVLPDGTYVTWWHDTSTTSDNIIHVSAAGTLLNSFNFVNPGDFVNHLAYASKTASTHVRVWIRQGTGGTISKIGNFNLSTGVFDSFFLVDTFNQGQNSNTNDNTKFGPSASCPLYTLFSTPPGLFKIPDPRKGTDSDGSIDVAIPNPTFRTALLP